MMTSRRRSSTSPCIIVLRVSGPSMTPPPLTPALVPPVLAAVGRRDDVEAAGADESRRPERIEGRLPVTEGYRWATCDGR